MTIRVAMTILSIGMSLWLGYNTATKEMEIFRVINYGLWAFAAGLWVASFAAKEDK